MKCRLDYCIYNDKNICILEKIELDALGMCSSCILVYLPPDALETQKAKQRDALGD